MKTIFRTQIAIIMCSFMVLSFFPSCEKDIPLTQTEARVVAPNEKMNNPMCTNSNLSYAVSLYQAGVPAELYEINASTGDWTGLVVPITGPGGISIENVTGISRVQSLVSEPEPFYVVSLGDNSGVPGLPSTYSNHVWKIDVNTGEIISLFRTLSNPITDICAGDFSISYWQKNGCSMYNSQTQTTTLYDCTYTTGIGMVGIEETPRPSVIPNQSPGNVYHLVYFSSYTNPNTPPVNFTPIELPLIGLPVNEEVQGLTWVRDMSGGCPVAPGMEEAVSWTDHLGNYHPSLTALIVVTYDPTTYEHKRYEVKFNQSNTTDLTAEAIFKNIIAITSPPTLNTHFSIGWMSDECTGGPVGNMLIGGNLQQFPIPSIYTDFFENCNPVFQNAQPVGNTVPVEVADFATIIYSF